MKNTLKRCLPDVLVIVLFVLIAFAYFYPADFEGRILYRHDSSAGRGMGRDISEYFERTGESCRWTNTIFSGMPTYQIAPGYKSFKVLDEIRDLYHLWLPDYVWYLFAYLLGFYILLRAFDFRQSLAALGSIVWAFSTYFLIIIAAGHIWKVMALAYLPPLIAGIVLAYKGKYMWGLALTSVFAALEIQANHVQMTYYYLIVIICLVLAFLAEAIREKYYAKFLKATGICIIGALIGVLINLPNLYHTWEYSKETMRGKSELVKPKSDSGKKATEGLDRDYITQWSYGVDETWTLLIPNAKGGASVPMSQNETAMKHADPLYGSIYQQIGQYWGEQPMTSGPVYVGAFVCLLFILGLFIVKGPIKWALLVATIISIVLSWGKNFMGPTDFCIDYVPMYSKFRTVSSILVVAEFTIPLLAMLTLKAIIDDPNVLRGKRKWFEICSGVVAGVCLLFAIVPGVFFSSFVSTAELQALSQWPAEQLVPFLDNLKEVRKAIFTADCWRSFFIIVVGVVLIQLYRMGKLKAQYTVGAIIALCIIDLWPINKRYLNDEMFVDKSIKDTPVQKTPTEEWILQDDGLNYRVLNLATNTFNENETSYYLKSIGGYHAAKLRRYQELIDAHLYKEMKEGFSAIAGAQANMDDVDGNAIYPVLNMLNAKYFILPLQDGKTLPLLNPYALGNAWFVDEVRYVETANEELDALDKIDLRQVAVADKSFEEKLGYGIKQDSTSVVNLVAYEPNELKYEVSSKQGGIIVFSEIYYPGWTATVDGVEVPVGRVNYVLRAINVTAGKHEVILSFFPKTVTTTETIAFASYALLLIVFVLLIYSEIKKKKWTSGQK